MQDTPYFIWLKSLFPNASHEDMQAFLTTEHVQNRLRSWDASFMRLYDGHLKHQQFLQSLHSGRTSITVRTEPAFPKSNGLVPEKRPVESQAVAVAVAHTPAVPVESSPIKVDFSVRNAKQNEKYCEKIDTTVVGVEILSIDFSTDIGLVFDAIQKQLVGKPIVEGKYTARVVYRMPGIAERLEGTLDLFINTDPKSLWKNIPSDPQAVYAKSDSAAQALRSPLRRVIAARQRGRSHAHMGTFCEDDFHIDYCGQWHIAVVADGAGSAKYARYGSHLVVERSSTFLKECFQGSLGVQLMKVLENNSLSSESQQKAIKLALYPILGGAAHASMKALSTVVQDPKELVQDIKELHTTLLIGISRKVGHQWFSAAYWVGDGAIAVYQKGQAVTLLGSVDAGEYSGQTKFLSVEEMQAEALMSRISYTWSPNYTAMLLMTDGVSDSKFSSESSLTEHRVWDAVWDELSQQVDWNRIGAEHQLLDWLDFWSAGNHDDRTIALIY